MKTLIVVFMSVGLMACGGSGGSSDSGPSDGLQPSCKSLYDEWQSTTDSERHDFSSLANGFILQEYEYTAYDGVTCGYTTNPNHNLSAEILDAEALGLSVPWDYQLSMRYSLAMGGQCATYEVAGSVGQKDQAAFIVMSCNEIQICEDAFANSLGTCKTFR